MAVKALQFEMIADQERLNPGLRSHCRDFECWRVADRKRGLADSERKTVNSQNIEWKQYLEAEQRREKWVNT